MWGLRLQKRYADNALVCELQDLFQISCVLLTKKRFTCLSVQVRHSFENETCVRHFSSLV